MTQSKIVILEADQYRRDYIRSIVSDRGYIPYIFEKETICLDNLLPLDPDLVISGPLSNSRVSRFVNTVKMKNCSLPVLIISGDRTLRYSADSNGFGDVRILKVNFEPSEIKGAIRSLLRNRIDNTGNGDPETPMIIGSSPELLKIKKLILNLKSFREPVLIQGEPGTGKELVARALHHHSGKRTRPFVKVNLAALDFATLNELIAGTLPGKSANPERNTQNAVSVEDSSTMFLDKLAALPAPLQSRLLNIFKDGHFQLKPTGRDEINWYEGRMIFSSNSLLENLVRRGKFRQDLYYRLNVISIIVPPLRDRVCDIPVLMDFFADKFCMELGVGHIELSKKVKGIFSNYHWPGNVRELENMTRRAILHGDKDSVVTNLSRRRTPNKNLVNPYKDAEDIPGINGLKKRLSKLNNLDNLSLKKLCNDFLARTEKKIITKALGKTNWNRKKAAGLLDISYKSLLNKIKKYKLAR